MPPKFYAVRCGRTPGIYRSWPECNEQVSGFSGAVFKSFALLAEATRFLVGEGQAAVVTPPVAGKRKRQTSPPGEPATQRVRTEPSPVAVVYTDGSCLGNGRPDARAGVGVWFGEGDTRSVCAFSIPG